MTEHYDSADAQAAKRLEHQLNNLRAINPNEPARLRDAIADIADALAGGIGSLGMIVSECLDETTELCLRVDALEGEADNEPGAAVDPGGVDLAHDSKAEIAAPSAAIPVDGS